MFEIEAVAPTPLPRVVEVKHCHHLSLTHLHQQKVESCQDGIVIDARLYLQGGLDLGLKATFTIGAYQDAQVVNAPALHLVQFLDESFAVASLPFRAEDSTIPKVSTDVIVRLSTTHEMTVLNLDEVRLFRT